MEEEGFNVCPAFGSDRQVIQEFFLDADRRPRIDLALAFSLKFQSSLNQETLAAVQALGRPIFNVHNMYYSTVAEWREDPRGLAPLETAWAVANPEITGLIEPGVLTGKEKSVDPQTGRAVFSHLLIEDNLEHLLPRLRMWVDLQRRPNAEKKVAILFYNNSQGKQNIGASYLNVFASLSEILTALKGAGYQVDEDDGLTAEGLQKLILTSARNVGAWAPGELDEMIASGGLVQIPFDTYRQWWDKLPGEFRDHVLEQWGPIENSSIMARNGQIIVPAVRLGHLVLLPEPARGYVDDPQKLYHSPTLYPHHQYVAAYLWLKHGFQANAVIHLGTHGTHEWLPGKQAGLSKACPPEVLHTDIPNIYPYIVDDVGEGLQAKRRGRAVVIDHLTPAVREGGLYQEYSRLFEMIGTLRSARGMDSQTVDLRFEKVKGLVEELGIGRDLGLTEIDESSLPALENYLMELKSNFMPYGLHTFGRSPQGEALDETVLAVLKQNPDQDRQVVIEALQQSGPLETSRLLQALDGRFIPAGLGNDPIRNPRAAPTGKDFYGFDPARIPSPAAYELGRRAAEGLVQQHLDEKNSYPQKVAVVLWATETIRNEGVNESTILHLMGLKPVWSASGRVEGLEVVPGSALGRPRIDVLINPSGLYRDLFPNLVLLLDQAVARAIVQTDIENLIARHAKSLEERLVADGVAPEEARELSRLRIFSEKPGSYGTGVSEMASASSLWESDREVSDVYANYVGHAFGNGHWGTEARRLLKANLADVDVALHSISSNIYGTMDNDDMFMYLGGLSLAAKAESGVEPKTVVTMQRRPDEAKVENLALTLGRELRTRYLNPRWVEGMKKEGYAGAREMSNFVEYMWGWQVTVNSAVDEAKWRQTYEVYVRDKYDLKLKDFFHEKNPWAFQSITARMLEAVRKDYWAADDQTVQNLAVEYAVNVVQEGVACCDHTCNNPFLNQMVVSVISLPGLMSPEMVEKFKLAVEKAAGKTLDQQVSDMRQVQEALTAGFSPGGYGDRSAQESNPGDQGGPRAENQAGPELKSVEGFKMEDLDPEVEQAETTSSGVQWLAGLFVLAIMAVFALGWRRQSRSAPH